MKKLLFLIVVIGLFAAWWQWGTAGPGKTAPVATTPAAQPATPAATALPPSAVLNIDPKLGVSAGAAAVAAAAGKLPTAMSPVLAEYIARKDYPTLFNKLKTTPDNAEALFLRAQILERCARKTDAATTAPAKTADERRAAFAATLKADAPDTARRLAAYDVVNADPCGELRTVETTSKEIADLRAKAAEMKDPTALARELNCEVFGSANAATGNRFAEMNDSRNERIRQAIASRSPIAVRAGVGMLSNTYRNGFFSIGPEGKPVDVQVMSHVANVMACQYGADCNADLQRACANDGKCDASNYNDFLSYYQLSPADAQVAEQYRAWLTQMIDSGDFTRLQLVPGEQSTDRVRLGSYFSCGS